MEKKKKARQYKINNISYNSNITNKIILKLNFFNNTKVHFQSPHQQGPQNRHIVNGQESVYIYISQIGRL